MNAALFPGGGFGSALGRGVGDRQHLDGFVGAAGVRDADRDAFVVEDGGAGQAVVHLGPGMDVDADAIKARLHLERRQRASADAINVDMPRPNDRRSHADGSRKIKKIGRRLQRPDVRVE